MLDRRAAYQGLNTRFFKSVVHVFVRNFSDLSHFELLLGKSAFGLFELLDTDWLLTISDGLKLFLVNAVLPHKELGCLAEGGKNEDGVEDADISEEDDKCISELASCLYVGDEWSVHECHDGCCEDHQFVGNFEPVIVWALEWLLGQEDAENECGDNHQGEDLNVRVPVEENEESSEDDSSDEEHQREVECSAFMEKVETKVQCLVALDLLQFLALEDFLTVAFILKLFHDLIFGWSLPHLEECEEDDSNVEDHEDHG